MFRYAQSAARTSDPGMPVVVITTIITYYERERKRERERELARDILRFNWRKPIASPLTTGRLTAVA